MQTNITHTIPFFMVTDIEASLRFYAGGLGFSVTHQWEPHDKIEWCTLRRENAGLMLQEYRPGMYEATRHEGKLGLGVSIMYICNDALSLYHEFINKSIEVAEPFVGNNMWVISLRDPDGYNIFFESDTKVPEETKYSDWIKMQQHH